MNLTRIAWPLGWLPSADAVGGDPNGLLRMDNLVIDKNGAISLVEGQKQVANLSDSIGSFFSRVVDGTEYFWIGTGSTCLRYDQSWINPVSMVVPGAGDIGTESLSAFGDCLGQVICLDGSMRTKDSVRNPPLPLGLLTPIKDDGTGPNGQVNPQQPINTLPANYQVIQGIAVPSGGGFGITPDPSISVEVIFATPQYGPIDSTNLSGQLSFGLPELDINNDIIQFGFDVTSVGNDVSDVINVSIYFLLDGNPLDRSTWTNYYVYTFRSDQGALLTNDLPPGTTHVVLSTTRGTFSRSGNNSQLDWTGVIATGFTAVTDAAQPVMVFNLVSIIGGVTGQVNGSYNYIQMNVNNTGVYQAKSPVSPLAINVFASAPTPDFNVINGSVTLFPIRNDPQANEYWFFRKASTAPTIDPNSGLPVGSQLSNWNFVGKSTGGPFLDSLSDDQVIQLNIDQSLFPNIFTASLRLDDTGGGINDVLYGVEGMYNERMLYLSTKYVYLSDRLNPDAIDLRFTIKASGDTTEINLWLKKLTNNVLILGTTKGLYEISGTLLNAPDGSIDAQIISLGEAYPPISQDVCNWQGGLYYIAADGLRVTTGSNSVNLSPDLRHLFQNQYTGTLAGGGSPPAIPSASVRHGIPQVAIYVGLAQRYNIVAAHQKIMFLLPFQNGNRAIVVFDTVTKSYSLRDYHNPTGIFTSLIGEIFVAYFGLLHLIDYQQGFGWNDQGVNFVLRTIFDANAQPRNRKDTFTLKIVADTGNQPCVVALQKDGIGVTDTDETLYIYVGTFTHAGMKTAYFPLSDDNKTLGMRYSVQITDAGGGVKVFRLNEFTIEYEPRPEQLDYLRILPTNLGTIARKRWTSYAFVIDTLGNNITFTPFLDNVAWVSTGTVNNVTKLTFIFFFTSEAVATDMGGILSGGVFEFYGVNLEECVSEKLPTPVKFLVIPSNNYGTPNRKRHTSYKYQILTRGGRVRFTPILDGQSYLPSVVNTATKRTVEHFFSQSEGDIVGIDIGGTLETLDNTPLEFYGVIVPQQVEQLPDRLETLYTPNENFGVASPKRIRTLPIVIDTYGRPVTFTPRVDSSFLPGTTTLICSGKKTLYHYFSTDVFGTDYSGKFESASTPPAAFEFYGFGQPENVELLPVPKKFDQLGPMRFDKIGKIFGFRLRIIQNGSTNSLPYACYGDFDPLIPGGFIPLISGSIPTIPNYDNVYEVQFPKNINTTVFRLFLGPTSDSFHRYDVQVKVISSGMQSEARWLPIR